MAKAKNKKKMKTPPIVSQPEWEAARQQLLVKEKDLTRARDALAAERRRLPWMAVGERYEFDGPEHACRGCSWCADQVGHLAHLNARDATLAYASRPPQEDIERLKARMG